MKKKNYLIGVAGNIGVGKTTLTQRLADHLGWKAYFESVIDNPYLDPFYHDMKQWSFHLQIYFLAHRFRSQKEISDAKISAIQDRTIYEDVQIFARSLFEQGYMSKRDHTTYQDLFFNMVEFLPQPDVIIYLKASVDTLVQRIQLRGRDYERTIDRGYLEYLNTAYDRWIGEARDQFTILEINTEDLDLVNGETDLNDIIQRIREYCP